MFEGMTMCFYTANCQFHLAGGVYKNRAHFKKRPSFSPIFSVRPSSVILQTQRNENSPQSKGSDLGSALMESGSSNLILNHGNTVGIIGGVSALSTIGFSEKLVKWSIKDGEESPFVVCNDPFLNREIASRERKFAPYTRLRNTHNQFDVALVVDNLKHQRVFLEKSGAGCIVMPCYISNAWHDEISQGCSVPFLHIGECVAKELKEANLKPVETGSNLQIGVLAPYPTLLIGFYQEKLQNQGFEVVVPDEATMEHTVIPAMEALNRKDMEGARNLLRIALQVLLVRAVNTIILASDDMRSLLPPNDPLLKKCTDPMDALARSTLQWVKSRA